MHGLVGKVGLRHGGWAGEERAAVRGWHGLSCLCMTLQPVAELLESWECVAARTLTYARYRALEGAHPPIFGRAAALCSCWLTGQRSLPSLPFSLRSGSARVHASVCPPTLAPGGGGALLRRGWAA